jgi:hypothetical protein
VQSVMEENGRERERKREIINPPYRRANMARSEPRGEGMSSMFFGPVCQEGYSAGLDFSLNLQPCSATQRGRNSLSKIDEWLRRPNF